MHRPIIGITSGEVYNKEHPWSPYVYGQSYTYSQAVAEAGGAPVILPITSYDEIIDRYVDMAAGFLFAGGNDISPLLYGQELRHGKDISQARDDFEMRLLQKVLASGKPVLGICRGMQLINVSRGGTLIQEIKDFPDYGDHQSSDEAKDIEHLAHTLRLNADSYLARVFGRNDIMTNSHHHQAIDSVGEGLIVNARAEDGLVEGIEDMRDGYIVAVQSHPESLLRVQPAWRLVFEAHVKASTPK